MQNEHRSETCFLLTRSSGDYKGRFVITLHGINTAGKPVKCVIDTFRPLFFVPKNTLPSSTESAVERRDLPLTSMDGTPVDSVYFSTYSSSLQCAKNLRAAGIKTYESDIHPLNRFLMERMVCGGFCAEGFVHQDAGMVVMNNPRIRGTPVDISLQILSLDIETNTTDNSIYSIASSGKQNKVFIIGHENDTPEVIFCQNEKELLERWIIHLKQEDPDCIIGWNLIGFDLVIIKTRCEVHGLSFDIGRDPGSRVEQNPNTKQFFVFIPGRAVVDIPVMLRANNLIFERMSLNYVATQVLGRAKIIEQTGAEKIKEINRLFNNDKMQLARYNLDDTILTRDIADKTRILTNAIERSKLSGRLLDEYGGSIAGFDYLYLPRLHRAGFVSPNLSDVITPPVLLSGGYVMEPLPGIYENVLLFDFKSLYPTIMVTFLIDPLGFFCKDAANLVGPTGTAFSRIHSLLPAIITELLDARTRARRIKNQSLSYAIKILMNSFYGVLGSTACRFFSPDIAQAITGTGQYIFKTTSAYIEKKFSYPVIYGDTDSLFLHIGPGQQKQAKTLGQTIIADVNTWLKTFLKEHFNADSILELQFEDHFRHFLMPSIRGGTQGSKKRYCGTREQDGKLILTFKGMESVRSDWTALAKNFQNTLYEKVFKNEPVDELILETVQKIRLGKSDADLVYSKQLRKPVSEYTVHIPPHAQAAKLLENPGHVIRYVITTHGPQPIEKQTAPLDYDHYVLTQIKPIADSILELVGKKFDDIVSGQQDLFGAVR